MLKNRSTGEAGELINSSDIPDGTKTVTTWSPGSANPPKGSTRLPSSISRSLFGKSSWAVNKTNMKMLIKLFGDDETKLVGKKIKLEVIKARNPQTGEFVPIFFNTHAGLRQLKHRCIQPLLLLRRDLAFDHFVSAVVLTS